MSKIKEITPIELKDINDNLIEVVYLLGLILMELKQQ